MSTGNRGTWATLVHGDSPLLLISPVRPILLAQSVRNKSERLQKMLYQPVWMKSKVATRKKSAFKVLHFSSTIPVSVSIIFLK